MNLLDENGEKNERIIEKSSEILDLMKKNTPQIDRNEIFFNDSNESQAAESWIYKFGNIISNFENKDELNLAMRVMSAVAYVQVIKAGNAFESDILNYFQIIGHKIEYSKIQEILEKISKEKYGPLIIRAPSISFSRIGRLLYTSYKKIKSDLLAREKQGDSSDLYWALEDAKTFLLYNEMGIDLDTIFSLSYNLRCAIEQAHDKVGTLLHKNKVLEHLNNLREIIKNIETSDIWKSGTEGNVIKLDEYKQISGIILDACKTAYELLSVNISYQTTKAKSTVQNPISKIPDYIIDNWNSIDWVQKLVNFPNMCFPVKYTLIMNKIAIANALRKFFEPKFVSPTEELPEIDGDMEEIEEKELIFQTSISTIEEVQNKIILEILETPPDYDHEITLVHDRLESIRRINCILGLNMQQDITLKNPVEMNNPIEDVNLYTSHQITKISTDLSNKIKESESNE